MSKVKVLPVYPKFPDTFWGFREALRFVGKKAVMPPTGLLTALAMLPEDRFEPQAVVDLNVEPLTEEQLRDTDVVFTSTMVVQEDSHNEVLDKARFYGKKVVAGGPFPTSYPERNSRADFIVAGEAEVTLPSFLEDLLAGRAERIYTEESVRGRNPVQMTKGGKVVLTQTPIPRWDLVDLKHYSSAAIQYSRGCPFDCDFCDITKLFGREPRTKTPSQMIMELDALKKRGYRGSVFIVDDNFIGNRANLRELLPALIEYQKRNGYRFNFFTEASMNLAWPENREILEQMVEAGFNQVFVGIESGDNVVLEKMGKKQNTKMSASESVRILQEAGLEVTAGFIVGADGEKPKAFDNLFKLIQESGIVTPMPGLLTVMKGTRLYDRLKKEGRLRGESHGNNTHQLGFNFVPEMDEGALIEGYKGLLRKLFDDKNYYERCRVLRDRLGRKFQPSRGSNLKGMVYLARSLRAQLFASGGDEYAKYLVETALTRPGYFSEAVTQAIKLVHLKSITKAMLDADGYKPQTERWYNQFSSKVKRIREKYGSNVAVERAKVAGVAKRTLERARKKYNGLHEDFRKNATNAFEGLREKVRQTIGRYRV